MPSSLCGLGTAGSYRWVAGSVGGVSCFKPSPADLPRALSVWWAGQQESWHGFRSRWFIFSFSRTDTYTNTHSWVFCWHGFGPLVQREEHCKSIQCLSDWCSYPIMGMGVVQDDGNESSLNGHQNLNEHLWKIFERCVRQCLHHHRHHSLRWGNIFWKKNIHPSSTVLCNSSETVWYLLEVVVPLVRYFMLVFQLNGHLSVHVHVSHFHEICYCGKNAEVCVCVCLGLGSEEGQPFNMSLEAEMMLEHLKEQHIREVEDIKAQLDSTVSLTHRMFTHLRNQVTSVPVIVSMVLLSL